MRSLFLKRRTSACVTLLSSLLSSASQSTHCSTPETGSRALLTPPRSSFFAFTYLDSLSLLSR